MQILLNRSAAINNTRRRVLIAGASLAGLSLGWNKAALANRFPMRPVHMILPLPPGGAADRFCRLFAEELANKWSQPVVVESRPGGGLVVGTLALARSAPDCHTLGMIGSSLSVNHVLRDDLPYNALQDLQPLARVGYYTMAIIATADFPANNVAELLEVGRQAKSPLSCGSNGVGTSTEVALRLFSRMANIPLEHVPYNGGTKLYSDMLGGHIKVGFSIMGTADGFLQAGQLKLLGVTSLSRSSIYPDVPAVAEVLPNYEIVNWTGFATPAGIPKDIQAQLTADILEVAATPSVGKALSEIGIELAPLSGANLNQFIHSEIDLVTRIMSEQNAS